MALQMSRMAIFQTAAWRALWIKALTFNRTTLSAIRISLSPNAGTLIATCGGTQLFACGFRLGEGSQIANQPALSIGSRSLFIMNSMGFDGRERQLSRSVWNCSL